VGFEPTISAGERPQTYALDRAATGTGVLFICLNVLCHIYIRIPAFRKFADGTGIVSSHMLLNTHLPQLGSYLVFYFISSKASGGVIRGVEMGGACGTYGGYEIWGFGVET